jgi:imidazolonepropionase-like amidohydrolase
MRQLLLLFVTAFLVKQASPQIYITNVSILDVEKQQVTPGQTVVITGNTITAIASSAKITAAAGAVVIDGNGKFLMPGMTDAHVHFFQSGGLYTRPDAIDLRKYMPYEKEITWVHRNMEDLLRRYLQNGITTVIDLGATLNFLRQRDSFKNKIYAPDIYMTGPLITTWEPPEFKQLGNNEPFYEVATAEAARAMVKKQLPFKPDFIKIWYIAAIENDVEATARKYLPLVRAIIAEAHKNNLKVAVHATERITAQLAVESGCDYLVHGVDDEIVNDAFLQLLKKKHTILCPTLVVAGNYSKVFAQQTNHSYAELTKSNPVQLGSLYDLKHLPDTDLVKMYKGSGEQEAVLYSKNDTIRMLNLKKMLDAGIPIASGTDAGNIGTLHASSYFEELKAMKRAGMSNWQVITASTINGAKAVGKEKQSGSIVVGKKANMILLNANPVDNLDNLQQIQLLVNKGHVIKPDTLIKETPESLVNRQLNGYNALNLEAFLEPYADDVELYDFPDKLVGKGKQAMRKMYEWLDKLPNLHCEIKSRVIQGNIVTDRERVTGMGDKPIEGTAVYHIENNRIKKVYFKE